MHADLDVCLHPYPAPEPSEPTFKIPPVNQKSNPNQLNQLQPTNINQQDHVAMLWDLAEGKRLYSLDAGDIIHALCFSPNRYWLCAATQVIH